MRLKSTTDNILVDEYNYEYPFTQRKGKSEIIEKFINSLLSINIIHNEHIFIILLILSD